EPEAAPEFTPADPEHFAAIDQVRARGGWTIQLVAGNLEQTALNVISSYSELDNLVYTRGERQGQPWFMVFYGEFPSREAANAAASGLPEELASRSPWVRPVDNL
ncbi:SPOR domain-containing protein, partial [Marinobacter adhaerens]|uniref:SPOR domain-containing protein n=1 Tax=Marinobacter adhaerens TaxID=1033846 RepID=UPI001E342666